MAMGGGGRLHFRSGLAQRSSTRQGDCLCESMAPCPSNHPLSHHSITNHTSLSTSLPTRSPSRAAKVSAISHSYSWHMAPRVQPSASHMLSPQKMAARLPSTSTRRHLTTAQSRRRKSSGGTSPACSRASYDAKPSASGRCNGGRLHRHHRSSPPPQCDTASWRRIVSTLRR